MSSPLDPDLERAVGEIAARHGVSFDAGLAMFRALSAGGGTMAQFSIPELGGSGQWIRGGMTMVGDMFDHGLKARVDALCAEMSQIVRTSPTAGSDIGFVAGSSWWPADLGAPSSTGGQNDARYAIFPAARRLAVRAAGVTRVFDTGEHRISGVQQQQGGGPGAVTFTSQLGSFDVSALHEVTERVAGSATPDADPGVDAVATTAGVDAVATTASADIIATIESLAGLHQRGTLTDDEFSAKKADLLGRL